eukprot:gnl/Carplike_NY0171/3179_a4272_417.p1 GENE.gnl/Carplike_NY0171/3179_a4272_417~~gnl/Carplike_NY0171/3179_a4272_417.p1  ORF type:complete len:134 (+),score=6.80 gnl/Carplike_NY0171/3179_a4272_417:61-462(+)
MIQQLILDQLIKKISKDGLTSDNLLVLFKLFPNATSDATEFVDARLVSKIIQKNGSFFWVVQGQRKPYLVLPEGPFCSCYAFSKAARNPSFELPLTCKHCIAVFIASARRDYEIVEFPEDAWRKELLYLMTRL